MRTSRNRGMAWATAAVFALGCGTQVQIAETPNRAPTVGITVPSDEAEVEGGKAIDFVGVISDEDGLDDLQQVSWTSSEDGLLADEANALPDASGTSTVSAVLSVGTHAITLRATDHSGLTGTDTITLHVVPQAPDDTPEPPTVSILEPADQDALVAQEPVGLVGAVDDEAQDPDTLEVTWTVEGVSGGAPTVLDGDGPGADGHVETEWIPEPGVWQLTLTAENEAGLQDSETITVEAIERPSVTIVEPMNQAQVVQAEPLPLEGVVTDGGQSNETLDAVWVVTTSEGSDQTEFYTGQPNPDGTFFAEWLEPGLGVWEITLVAENDAGLEASDTVTVEVLEPPTVEILEPLPFDEFLNVEPVLLAGSVTHGTQSNASLVATWTLSDPDGSDSWELYTGNPAPDGFFTTEWPYPEPGAWTITLSAESAEGFVSEESITFYVENDVIYLDPTLGNDGDDGLTPDAPVQTLDAAYDAADDAERRWIYIGGDGDVLLAGSFQEGVQLAGGFDPADDWMPDPMLVPTIPLPSNGALISNWTEDTFWRGIRLEADGNSSTGGSSIVLRVSSSKGLVLEDVEVVAGHAGNGSSGGSGSHGGDGQNGQAGEAAITDSSFMCPSNPWPMYGPRGDGGSGCSWRRGGHGGYSGWGELAPGTSDGDGKYGSDPGQAGASGGGSGGWAGTYRNNGGNGLSGSNGSHGNNGSGGSGVGTFTAWSYWPSHGSSGWSGAHGTGGGGGGGAGGGTGQAGNAWCNAWGGAGGGGGGAGCGGSGGIRGTGGGASVGIVLINATLVVDGGYIQTGNGGDGGHGGAGGSGGQGGQGGLGGESHVDTGSGGRGGDGGNGGNGGHGGGGGGGPTIGIVCQGTSELTLTNDPAPVFSLGTRGQGGSSPGDSGQLGERSPTHGC